MSVPPWIREATEPLASETEPLLGLPDDLRALAQQSTEPLVDEVQAVRRAVHRPSSPSWNGTLAAGLALAAVLLGLVGIWAGHEVPPYQMAGSAGWTVQETGPDVRVEQGPGLATWAVDPVRPSGVFQVVAGDVVVTVLGTVFTVDHAAPEVVVAVREGRVQVDHPWGRSVLSAGERWVRSEEAARHAPEPVVARVWPERSVALADREPRPVVLPAPQAEPNDSAAAFVALLDRVEAGEASAALIEALEAFGEEAPELAPEVAAVVLGVRARIDLPEEVLADLDAWLAEHPRHPRHPDLLEARATVARARLRRCDLALPSYRALARRSVGVRRQRALAWQGLCASGMGLSAEARTALQAALEAGLTGGLAVVVRQTLEQL